MEDKWVIVTMKTIFFHIISCWVMISALSANADETTSVEPAPDMALNNQPNGQADYIQHASKDLMNAANGYVSLINKLYQENNLRNVDKTLYLPQQLTGRNVSFTPSGILGLYAVRIMPFEAESIDEVKWFFHSTVIFLKDGAGFFTRQKIKDGKYSSAWLVYDTQKAAYFEGDSAQPYVEQVLKMLDTNQLPQFGSQKPTFIYNAAYSCGHCGKLQSALEKSGLSYRAIPSDRINYKGDMPYVLKTFCSADKAQAFKAFMTMQNRPNIFKDPKSYNCPDQKVPYFAIEDIKLIFGDNPTPFFYFPDGSVISGVSENIISELKAKSLDMQKRKLYFH